jgi:hypothetical protein
MSVTYIPDSVKYRLWGKAAGRCEYEGCNERLWLDSLTQSEFNVAYIAHIVADSPIGPRGDAVHSEQLKGDINNLMLLCDECHRHIDRADVAGHPVARLQNMKRRHEARIDTVTDIAEGSSSHILLYGANVGDHSATASVSFEVVRQALLPYRYPADRSPIEIGFQNSAIRDRDPSYWEMERRQLRSAFQQKVKERRDRGEIAHLSVFALAPQPLLITLGTELGDIGDADVFQLCREPPGWRLEDDSQHMPLDLSLSSPLNTDGRPALVLSVSARISHTRVHAVLGDSVSIWTLAVPAPGNDIVRSRAHLAEFRTIARQAFNAIKAAHGASQPLHVFSAMPVSFAVELGRVWMPKADLAMSIFDEMNRRFVPTFTLGVQNQEEAQ